MIGRMNLQVKGIVAAVCKLIGFSFFKGCSNATVLSVSKRKHILDEYKYKYQEYASHRHQENSPNGD